MVSWVESRKDPASLWALFGEGAWRLSAREGGAHTCPGLGELSCVCGTLRLGYKWVLGFSSMSLRNSREKKRTKKYASGKEKKNT